MAAILEISAQVPQDKIDALVRAFDRYQENLGNTQVQAIRRGTIAMIKSLRARTDKARDRISGKEYKAFPYKGGDKPHYITTKSGAVLHRWTLIRKANTPDRKSRDYYVYSHRKTNKRGREVADRTAEKRELLEEHGRIRRWSLAKKSWGHFMQSLFRRANPESKNPQAKIKSGMTDGYLREIVTGANPRVEVLIVNHLNYIRRAIPDVAVDEAILAATNSINAQIDKGLAKARKELE